MTSRKIGILGGTFDPIHNGHINLAIEAQKLLNLNCILFVPNNNPLHKKYDNYKDYKIHRLNMLKIALKPYPMFQISNIELNKNYKSYTYETIYSLSKIFNNDKLYFIMGEDSFFAFHTWKNPVEICKYATLVVAKRENMREDFIKCQQVILKNEYNAKVIIMNNHIVEASSHNIRNGNIFNLNIIPNGIVKYIKDNHLYNYHKLGELK